MANNKLNRGKNESRSEYINRMDRFAKQAGVYKKAQEERHATA